MAPFLTVIVALGRETLSKPRTVPVSEAHSGEGQQHENVLAQNETDGRDEKRRRGQRMEQDCREDFIDTPLIPREFALAVLVDLRRYRSIERRTHNVREVADALSSRRPDTALYDQ